LSARARARGEQDGYGPFPRPTLSLLPGDVIQQISRELGILHPSPVNQSTHLSAHPVRWLNERGVNKTNLGQPPNLPPRLVLQSSSRTATVAVLDKNNLLQPRQYPPKVDPVVACVRARHSLSCLMVVWERQVDILLCLMTIRGRNRLVPTSHAFFPSTTPEQPIKMAPSMINNPYTAFNATPPEGPTAPHPEWSGSSEHSFLPPSASLSFLLLIFPSSSSLIAPWAVSLVMCRPLCTPPSKRGLLLRRLWSLLPPRPGQILPPFLRHRHLPRHRPWPKRFQPHG
jgi:hypothetical protein